MHVLFIFLLLCFSFALETSIFEGFCQRLRRSAACEVRIQAVQALQQLAPLVSLASIDSVALESTVEERSGKERQYVEQLSQELQRLREICSESAVAVARRSGSSRCRCPSCS